MKRFWDIISGKCSNSYIEAVESLERIENVIKDINHRIPDIRSFDFSSVKNKCSKLMPELCGTPTMSINVSDEYRSIIGYYCKESLTITHVHSTEWEVIKVLEGSAEDKISGTKLTKGDIYVIPKGVTHHITTDDECYLYVLFTSDREFLKIPNSEPKSLKKVIENHRTNNSTEYNTSLNKTY